MSTNRDNDRVRRILMETIRPMAVEVIKRTGHSHRKQPWCLEIPFDFPEIDGKSPEDLAWLVCGVLPISDTDRMTKWHVTHPLIIQNFLDMHDQNELIHPVYFDGRVRRNPITGHVPTLYCYARIVEVKAKFDKRLHLFTIQFRTRIVDSHSDEHPLAPANAFQASQLMRSRQPMYYSQPRYYQH